MQTVVEIDLGDPDNFVPGVPHHMFDWLRENAPVYRHERPGQPPFWCLTRWAEVEEASREWRRYSSAHGTNIDDPVGGAELMMLNMDPPAHTKLRNLVRKAFTPRMVSALQPHIRDIAEQLVDRIAHMGECDFVTEISAELPLQVICELLGVPLEDRHMMFHWSNQMIGFEDPEYATNIDTATTAAMSMYQFAGMLGQQRRFEPKQDLVTALIEAEVDGEKLNEIEFSVFFLLLAVAGNETTRNLISGGLTALLEHPSERDRLTAERALMPTAVDEMLRWVTPVMHFRRTAMEDFDLRGEHIRAGDKVILWYISANRDEEMFPGPHRFDAGRTPNEHLAFGGGGPHFCLGMNLARLEIEVMFDVLLDRLPDIELAGPPSRMRSNFINGTKHLPVRFGAR